MKIAVIGGGAAGYFGAIAAAETAKEGKVVILEGTRKTLTKVRISGGGRCNVTHHCFDPAVLVKSYPRGERELRGPFSRFQPSDTVAWFAQRGVDLKAEADGRMFPITDNSQTVIDCLTKASASAGVETRLGIIVKSIMTSPSENGFLVKWRDGEEVFDRVLLATGSSPSGHNLAQGIGHTITPLAPSLFTFNIENQRLKDLAGLSFPDVELTLQPRDQKQVFKFRGPILITHWGLSGPAVLKLSAIAARELFASEYRAQLKISFVPKRKAHEVFDELWSHKGARPKDIVANCLPGDWPKRYNQRVFEILDLEHRKLWHDISREQLKRLVTELCETELLVCGKGVFKEEFVTCGGVDLREIDLKTMESRLVPGLYFAGEIMDIDGITGGFNFQNAWTTSWIAGQNLAAKNL